MLFLDDFIFVATMWPKRIIILIFMSFLLQELFNMWRRKQTHSPTPLKRDVSGNTTGLLLPALVSCHYDVTKKTRPSPFLWDHLFHRQFVSLQNKEYQRAELEGFEPLCQKRHWTIDQAIDRFSSGWMLPGCSSFVWKHQRGRRRISWCRSHDCFQLRIRHQFHVNLNLYYPTCPDEWTVHVSWWRIRWSRT